MSERQEESLQMPPGHHPMDPGSVGTFSRLPWVGLVIGLLLRFGLAPYTAESNDVSVWAHASLSGFYGLHLYDRAGFSYPPVWGYCLQIIGWIVRFAGNGPSFFATDNPDLGSASQITADFSTLVTSPMYNVAFKAILFGCDLASALVIYRVVAWLTRDQRRARMAFAMWFLNPFVIYESAVDGAADTLVGFTVIATIALVLFGRPASAGVAWALGIMTKVSPVALAIQLVVMIGMFPRELRWSVGARVRPILLFGMATLITTALLVAPQILAGSTQVMVHSTFARAQGTFDIGGLSFFGIRHLKPWAWLLQWAANNAAVVVRLSTLAQAVSALGWAAWTLIIARRSPAFAFLTGTIGTLASAMLLSPIANPQYVLWWLPVLITLIAASGRGYWQYGVLTVAPLVFAIAVLGPVAFLAPLATYTHVIPTNAVADRVIQWYVAPGKLWGMYWTDDFFAPAALATIAALISLFATWWKLGLSHQEPRFMTSPLP